MVFHWSLSDSNSLQISRTLLSILTDFNNAVLKGGLCSSSDFQPFQLSDQAFGIIPSTSITTGITVIFMFHSFHSSLVRSKYLFLFLFSLIFTLWSAGTTKFTSRQVLFFFFLFFYYLLLGFDLLTGIR